MKTIIIFAILFVTMVAGDEETTDTCIPGETKMMDCNSCFCIEDGSGWGCTEMACISYPPGYLSTPELAENLPPTTPRSIDSQSQVRPEDEPCESGTRKMIECNTCRCIAGGWVCTRKGCI